MVEQVEVLQHAVISPGKSELQTDATQVLLALVKSYSFSLPQKLASFAMVLQAAFILEVSIPDVLQHCETSPGVSLLHVFVAQVLLALVESYSLPLPQKLASFLMVLQASFVLDSVRDVLQHFETSPGVSLLHVDVAQVLLALAESYSLPLPQNLAVLAIVLQAAPLLEDGLQVFVELVQNGFVSGVHVLLPQVHSFLFR